VQAGLDAVRTGSDIYSGFKCVRENSIRGFTVEHDQRFLAAKRRKNAAHGASRGRGVESDPAPKGRKTSSHAHSLSPCAYAGNLPNSPLAFRNHGRSRRRRYPGIVGFFSRILCAQMRASAFRPCDSKYNA